MKVVADEHGWELLEERANEAPGSHEAARAVAARAPGSGVFRKVGSSLDTVDAEADTDPRATEIAELAGAATDPAPASGEEPLVRLPPPSRVPGDLVVPSSDDTRVA